MIYFNESGTFFFHYITIICFQKHYEEIVTKCSLKILFCVAGATKMEDVCTMFLFVSRRKRGDFRLLIVNNDFFFQKFIFIKINIFRLIYEKWALNFMKIF